MDKERHVRKSNIFIEGRYRFGLQEQRILLAIISNLRIDDVDFQSYRFTWNEIKDLTKNKIKRTPELIEVCEALRTKSIQVKEDGKIKGFGFLTSWYVDPGRWVQFQIHPDMKTMLLDLLREGRFTLYKLQCVLSLGSSYSVRLYELLKAHEWKKQPVVIPLADIKWSMDIPKGSLNDTRFDLFRSRVLEKAKKDIEKHTDIKFTYLKVLELRKVIALQFTISENKKYQPTLESHVSKTDLIRNGDNVLLDGKTYRVEGNNICLDDGCLPIGRLNELLKKGVIHKV